MNNLHRNIEKEEEEEEEVKKTDNNMKSKKNLNFGVCSWLIGYKMKQVGFFFVDFLYFYSLSLQQKKKCFDVIFKI